MSTLPIETLESNESLPLKAEALLARRAQQRPSVTALAVRPVGRPSLSQVVTIVTPVARWPRTRRNSSGASTCSF